MNKPKPEEKRAPNNDFDAGRSSRVGSLMLTSVFLSFSSWLTSINGSTSGSSFFTYALAWGLNHGLLDRAEVEPAVRKAWTALVACVTPDGKLTHVQPIGADPKHFAQWLPG